jgi:hypothetical protein
MHGDHIKPWIRGGLTIMTNLQALCGSCNLRKGSQPQQIIEQFFDVAAFCDRGAPSEKNDRIELCPSVDAPKFTAIRRTSSRVTAWLAARLGASLI